MITIITKTSNLPFLLPNILWWKKQVHIILFGQSKEIKKYSSKIYWTFVQESGNININDLVSEKIFVCNSTFFAPKDFLDKLKFEKDVKHNVACHDVSAELLSKLNQYFDDKDLLKCEPILQNSYCTTKENWIKQEWAKEETIKDTYVVIDATSLPNLPLPNTFLSILETNHDYSNYITNILR